MRHVRDLHASMRTHARRIVPGVRLSKNRDSPSLEEGRSPRPPFAFLRDLAKDIPPPVSPSTTGSRPAPAHSLALFAATPAITYRRVITARALSVPRLGSVDTIEMAVCARGSGN